VAGTATGVIVALWHLPLFFVSSQPQSTFSFLPFLLTLMAVRILFGWVYVGAGGSVLLCLLFHASGNAWSEVLPVPRPDFTAAWLAETAVFAIAAVVVLALWRRSRLGTSTASSTHLDDPEQPLARPVLPSPGDHTTAPCRAANPTGVDDGPPTGTQIPMTTRSMSTGRSARHDHAGRAIAQRLPQAAVGDERP
jgi:hypothetical protein